MEKKSNLTNIDGQQEKPVYVTQPSLPPLDEFVKYLEDI